MLLKEPADTVVGKGGCKSVYYAINLETGRKWAVSIFSKAEKSAEIVEMARNEALLLSKIHELQKIKQDFKSVLSSPGYIETEEEILTLMEYCEEGDLEKLLSRRQLSMEERKKFAREILKGALMVEKMGYHHRDLKLSNIFLKKDTDGSIYPVVADLGLACKKDNILNVVGVDDFMPPHLSFWDSTEDETTKKEIRKQDAWSMGLIFYRLFHPSHQHSTLLKSLYGELKEDEEDLIEDYDKSLKDLQTRLDKSSTNEEKQQLQHEMAEIAKMRKLSSDKIDCFPSEEELESMQLHEDQIPAAKNIQHHYASLPSAGVDSTIIQVINGLLKVNCENRLSLEEAFNLVNASP